MNTYAASELLTDPVCPFSIVPYYLEAGDCVEPHRHDFIEGIVVLEGQALHEGSAGDVFVVWPGEWHAYRALEDRFVYHYNILMDAAFYRKELLPFFGTLTDADLETLDTAYWTEWTRSWPKRKQHIAAERLGGLESQLKHASDHCRSLTMNRAMAKTVLWNWMLLVSECAAEDGTDHGPQVPGTDRLDWLIGLIRTNYTVPFSLRYASTMCEMSPTTFSQAFKERTGQTLIEFRNRIRLEAACEQLILLDTPVSQIALDCGFSDLSFFYTQFKSKYGMSPMAFRRLRNG